MNSKKLLDWLYPRRCAFCDEVLGSMEKYLCHSCRQNFGIYCNFSKLVLAFDMLAGRLEIFPMLVPVIYLLRKKQLS